MFPNHQWDVSGPKDISLTTIQPLLSYLPGGGWAVSSSGPITYNWEAEQWTIPLTLMVSRTVKFGHLPVKLALDCNYYLEQADALGQQLLKI